MSGRLRRRLASGARLNRRPKGARRRLKFREFEAEVRDALLAAAKARGYELAEVELLRPPNPELGDISSPVGLRLARETKKAPGVIAKELAETIDSSATWRLIGGVEAHDSGYVNFRTNWGLFACELLASVLKPEGGVLDLGRTRADEARRHRAHQRQPQQGAPHRPREEPRPGRLPRQDDEEAGPRGPDPQLHRRLGRAGRGRHSGAEVPRPLRQGAGGREVRRVLRGRRLHEGEPGLREGPVAQGEAAARPQGDREGERRDKRVRGEDSVRRSSPRSCRPAGAWERATTC